MVKHVKKILRLESVVHRHKYCADKRHTVEPLKHLMGIWRKYGHAVSRSNAKGFQYMAQPIDPLGKRSIAQAQIPIHDSRFIGIYPQYPIKKIQRCKWHNHLSLTSPYKINRQN